MKFVSYAQNFEDVMLWRALKHVECGFYIDVGANDPEIDSVTKAFYDYGWRGINIEPALQWFERLQEMRPRDINLQIAAGAQQGEMVFYELPDSGLSTINKATAERHEAEHGFKKIEHIVHVETLTSICESFHVESVHFLKIDVEGAEKNVLCGIDFSLVRPWIIVVESTLPMTQIQDHIQWEPILFAAKYNYAYFDGLNRYYVAEERCELKAHFHTPPNFFDGFVLSATQPFCELVEFKAQEQKNRALAAEAQLQQAEVKAQQAEVKAQQAEVKAQQAEVKAQQAEVKAQQAEVKAQQAEVKAQQAEVKAQQAEVKAQQAEVKAQQAEVRAQQAEVRAQQAEVKAQEAEAGAGQAQTTLSAIYTSRSWRITAPLRWAGNVARWFVRGSIAWLTFAPGSRPRRILRRVLISIKSGISHRPLLKAVVARLLSLFPQIDQRLRLIGNPRFSKHLDTSFSTEEGIEEINNLTPRARQIYLDLKASIEQRRKEQR